MTETLPQRKKLIKKLRTKIQNATMLHGKKKVNDILMYYGAIDHIDHLPAVTIHNILSHFKILDARKKYIVENNFLCEIDRTKVSKIKSVHKKLPDLLLKHLRPVNKKDSLVEVVYNPAIIIQAVKHIFHQNTPDEKVIYFPKSKIDENELKGFQFIIESDFIKPV